MNNNFNKLSINNNDALHISCDDCKIWEELDSDQPRTQAHSFTFNYDTEKWKCNTCEKIVDAKSVSYTHLTLPTNREV